MKSKVLVVAGGEWQVPIIIFLKNKDHCVYVVDPYTNSPGVAIADKHVQADVRDVDKIISVVKNEKFNFITTDQSDIAVNTVAKLNLYFKLEHNNINVTNRFVNKLSMRALASSVHIPIPDFCKIINVSDLQEFIDRVGLPIILKPVDSQSSRGISKIDSHNLKDVNSFIKDALAFSNYGYLIAEEFIEGQEVTVEGIASNYRHKTLALSLKKHFRTGIASELRYPAEIPKEIYNKIESINDKFVEKSGLRFGITHAEYMVDIDTGRISLIEIACRGGGTLISSHIVNWVSGINLYEELYKNMNGIISDIDSFVVQKNNAILQFFEFPSGRVKSINGIDEVQKMDKIIRCDLSFNIGDFILPAGDDRSRQGFFIAFGDTKEQLDATIIKVMDTINIQYY